MRRGCEGKKVRKEKRGEEENEHHRPSIPQFLPFEIPFGLQFDPLLSFSSLFFISFLLVSDLSIS